MRLIFQRGTTQTLWANFLSGTGEEPVTIVNPKITIRHYNPITDVVDTDINEAAMTLATETLYYYRWAISATAQEGVYTIEYEATVDGIDIESTQDVYVSTTTDLGGPGTAYTTPALVANLLGVEASEIDDDWIYWATAFIDTYTCQSWSEHTTTEKFDIDNGHTSAIKLEKYPIIGVDYVKDDGTTLDIADYLIYEDIGMIKLPDDTYLSMKLFSRRFFTQGRQKLEIKYTWGATTVPYEIQLCASLLAAKFGKIAIGPTASDVTQKTIGDTSIRYSAQASPSQGGTLGWTMSKMITELLSKYKCRDSGVV